MSPRESGGGTAPVDLRSDTVTRPSADMRAAMAEAEVADDVLEKDPTAGRLEERVAGLLGTEAALFFPSGTQANQAAVLLQAVPGSEVVCEAEAHVFHYELADVAMLAGAQLHRVPSERGIPALDAWRAAFRPGDRHHPVTSLACLENTHNMHGGVVVPLERLRALADVARGRGLSVHLDGARLWNAAAASGVDLDAYADCADTVMVSLSKGLGCPVGSILAGGAETIERAWSVRKRLGGGMRQVGILAAAGLWALDHNLERIPRDHERARRLATGCDELDGLRVPAPDTNIVMIHVERDDATPAELSRRMGERGVLILPSGPDRLRAVTHLDVDDRGIDRAVEALRDALPA